MNHRIVTVAAAAGLIFAATGISQAAHCGIDPAHTNTSFTVRHVMISQVRGEFAKLAGGLEVVGDDPTNANASVTIDAASINTRARKRDAHLRSADFFDVARFPTIAFASRKVERQGEARLKVEADPTIHGVTKEVTLDVDELTPVIKDMPGNLRVGAHATMRISRKDFGLLSNMPLEAGGVRVGDQVSITIDVGLIKKA